MEDIEIFSTNSSPNFGIVLGVLSFIPVLLNYTVFRPKFKKIDKKKLSKKIQILDILNKVLYIAVLVLFCIKRESFDIKGANAIFGIMTFFYIIYYELYFRYISRSKAQKELYSPFFYVKVPLYVSMSLSLFFASIWSKEIILIIVSAIFSITNIITQYIKYKTFFTEYRDLYDENRKYTGKKMLKDSPHPKGLRHVTVAVFIYSPKNKKWLMQKRSKDKGGKWATTSGHPISGQSSLDGMVTEIKEELGLDVNSQELELVTTVKREKCFVDIYYLEKDVELEDLKIQYEELTDIAYMTHSEVDAFYMNKKFKKTHYMYFEELLKAKGLNKKKETKCKKENENQNKKEIKDKQNLKTKKKM